MNYPAWICGECGERFGKRVPTCATWHEGDDCGWCERDDVPVTEPRDFGYPTALDRAIARPLTPMEPR